MTEHIQMQGSALWLLLAGGVIWGLVLCFLGYLLYRVMIVFGGLQGGVFLGVLLIDHYMSKPTGVDYFITCMCLAALFAMIAWFLHRLVFACLILAMTAAAMWVIGQWGIGAWAYVVVGFVGLVMAVLVFFFLKHIFIFVGSVVGAIAAVDNSMSLLLSKTQQDAQVLALTWPSGWTLAIMIVLMVVMAVAGMVSQFKLSHLVRTRLLPEAGKNDNPFVGRKMSKARLPVGKK